MKIITYNVNGIRAAMKHGLLDWLEAASPDVLCLQETKANVDQVDTNLIDELGYKHYWFSAQKKGYSGVSIWAKTEPKNVVYGTGIDYIDFEGRVIRADFEDFSVISVYVPSASNMERLSFKMKFCEDFSKYISVLKKEIPNLIISGDYNICHQAIDIHDPVRNKNVSGFLPEEREWLTHYMKENALLDSFRFFVKSPDKYSWWSYRANARANNKGWRIDYNMVSKSLENKMTGATILSKAVHSDHCPVVVELDFN